MSDQLWVVRAGREARFVPEFVEGSYVAIAFREFATDDLGLTDEEALRGRAHTKSEGSAARQLSSFAYRIDVSDLVIVPRLTKTHRDYLAARITAPYRHVVKTTKEGLKGSGNHQRPVEWLGSFARDSLSLSAATGLNGRSTLFRPTSAEEEIRAQLASLAPIDA